MNSYSRITCYEDCPYSFYLRYIANEEGDGNFWAEVGSIMHDDLRQIAIGDMSPDDAPSDFLDRYDNEVFYQTKEATMDAVFTDCMNFLSEYEYKYLEQYRVVAAEDHLYFDVDGVKFHGYIDLLLQDKETGDYIVMDYKSCKPFFGKRGKLLKAMEKTYNEYFKQMCLYCIAVEQNYGRIPKKVMWLHFRNQEITEVPITAEDIETVKKWVAETVLKIDQDQEFLPQKDWFKCHNLCDFRHTCQYLMFEDEEEGD